MSATGANATWTWDDGSKIRVRVLRRVGNMFVVAILRGGDEVRIPTHQIKED